MLMSMTGFSTRTITFPIGNYPVTFTLTLKSVNGRYFETICKMPYALTHLETEAIKIFKQQLIRGTIYFTVYASPLSALKSTVAPTFELIKNYFDGLHEVQKKYNIPGTLTISDISSLPYVFEAQEIILDPQTSKLFLQELQPLINDLVTERNREGTSLSVDLEQRIKKLQILLEQIKPRAREVMTEKKAQLMTTLEPFLQAQEGKDQQLQLIYNQLEKLDIHEELVRFATHLQNFKTILESTEIEKGKRLDFTLQELFREVNTMAAKCTDAQISSLTIAMKVEIEKAREQVQNIV